MHKVKASQQEQRFNNSKMGSRQQVLPLRYVQKFRSKQPGTPPITSIGLHSCNRSLMQSARSFYFLPMDMLLAGTGIMGISSLFLVIPAMRALFITIRG